MIAARLHYRVILLAALAGAGFLSSSARAQHSDIFLEDRDGRLATFGDSSVFPSSFIGSINDLFGRVQHLGTNPGFLALASDSENLPEGYTPLPGDRVLSFSIRSFELEGAQSANLWHWDGADHGGDGDYLDDVSFSPVDSGAAFRVYRGSANAPFVTSGLASGDDSDQPGFDLDATGSLGNLHDHPSFAVLAPDETPPELGIYVVSFDLQMEGLLDAEPVYIALRTSDTDLAALDAAELRLNELLTIPDPALLADFNGDGVVDLLDLDILGANFGVTGDATQATGDANGDTNVDLLDLDILGSEFGAGDSASIVPEPSPRWVLVIGAAALLVAQRRWKVHQLSRSATLAILASGFAAATPSQAAHLDAMLYQEDGRLRLAGYDFARLQPVYGVQVFQGTLLINLDFPGLAWGNNPGWATVRENQLDLLPTDASQLPAEAAVSFDIVPSAITGANLSHWDGAGPVSFGPPPADEVAEYGALLFSTTAVVDGSASVVSGFDFTRTSGTGYIHSHVPVAVYGDSTRDAFSSDAPTAGVYLIEIAAKVEGLRGSPSAHVLLGVGVDDTTLATADEWLSAQVVPEPTTLMVAAVCLAASATVRR